MQYLTVPEAAALLRLSESRVRQLVTAGEIPFLQRRRHGRILFRLADLQRTLQPTTLSQSQEEIREVELPVGANQQSS